MNINNCTFTIKDFYFDFSTKTKYKKIPNRDILIKEINDTFKKLIKSDEWRDNEEDYFGEIPLSMIKNINSITFVSGIRNIKHLGARDFGGDMTIKLNCNLIEYW